MQDQRTTTRRSALQSALTGLLAAGAASILPTTTNAAPPPVIAQQSVTVVNYADLAAECNYRKAEARRTLGVSADLSKVDPDTMMDEHQAHQGALIDNLDAEWAWMIAELQRHFPGLAPAIAAVAEHVQEETGHRGGECCEIA